MFQFVSMISSKIYAMDSFDPFEKLAIFSQNAYVHVCDPILFFPCIYSFSQDWPWLKVRKSGLGQKKNCFSNRVWQIVSS